MIMDQDIVTLARSAVPWLSSDGNQVAISSRVRLVRNLADERFPGWAKNEQQFSARERVHCAVADSYPTVRHWRMETLARNERELFAERRIAGKFFAKTADLAEVAIEKDQHLAFRINDGDHLKISCTLPGLNLFASHEMADSADNSISNRLEFAFDEKRGFLTADPADMGTGLRASLLLFLPALSTAEKIGQITHAIQQLGCSVGGFGGAGTGPEACIFQVHNRITLGESEETILRRMAALGETIAEQELAARSEMDSTLSSLIADRMARVIAMLCSARVVTLQEGLALLGQARLAASLGYIESRFLQKIDELLIAILPIHLQLRYGEWVKDDKLDALRADMLRQAFAKVQLLR
ncbi:MAG: hypothetical protein LBI39_01875 [Puniceicoccales bacterium]|jgi:protein arginine kinase|nr:hypothetical protein [Puniceicoccales bacterium]